jgi:hypothetical protein
MGAEVMSDYADNRITPEQVVAAYQATGLKPARTGLGWFTEDGCACGAAALIRARIEGFCNPYWPFPMAAACLGVSRPYLGGFVHGFDGIPFEDLDDPDDPAAGNADLDVVRRGYRDGAAAAAAVFGGVAAPPP